MAKEMSERKVGEFPSQIIPNLRGHEELKVVKILKSSKVIEVPQDLHWEEGKEVSTKASSTSTHIFETPRGQESSLSELIDKQKETIKVEKFPGYSPHSIFVHDSLSDEKLFEKIQSDLP
jgi:hypothetical protein